MKIIAVILFSLALWDIVKTILTIEGYKYLPSRMFMKFGKRKIISIGIQIAGDLLLIVFLWMWRG